MTEEEKIAIATKAIKNACDNLIKNGIDASEVMSNLNKLKDLTESEQDINKALIKLKDSLKEDKKEVKEVKEINGVEELKEVLKSNGVKEDDLEYVLSELINQANDEGEEHLEFLYSEDKQAWIKSVKEDY